MQNSMRLLDQYLLALNHLNNDETILAPNSIHYKDVRDIATKEQYLRPILTEKETLWIEEDLIQTLWIIERTELLSYTREYREIFNGKEYCNTNLHNWINIFTNECTADLRSILHLEYLFIELELPVENIKKLNHCLSNQWIQDKKILNTYKNWIEKDSSISNEKNFLEELNKIRFPISDKNYHHSHLLQIKNKNNTALITATILKGRNNQDLHEAFKCAKRKSAINSHKKRNSHRKQYNITLDKILVEKIDEHADRINISRSEIIEGLMQLYLTGKTVSRFTQLPPPLQYKEFFIESEAEFKQQTNAFEFENDYLSNPVEPAPKVEAEPKQPTDAFEFENDYLSNPVEPAPKVEAKPKQPTDAFEFENDYLNK